MPAIDLLQSQHREAESLLQQITQTTGGARVRLIGALAELLTMHCELEERYFYPMLRAEGMGEVIDRSFGEHGAMKRLLSDIMEMKQRDPRLGDLLARLDQMVRKHVQEEEGEVFPRAREVTDEALMRSAAEEMRRGVYELRDKELLEMADEQGGAAPV
jgi:hemerythrin superfamily protein